MIQEVTSRVSTALEGDDFFDIKDYTSFSPRDEVRNLIRTGVLVVSGRVERTSHHYVHERSTDCSLDMDWDWPNDMTSEDQEATEVRANGIVDEIQNEIDERMVAWNKKIYHELENAYNGEISDESISGTADANEWKFDEDGTFDRQGAFEFDQLSPDAKESVRSWYIESLDADWWSEPVILEWKWLLKNKGFDDVEIAFSGFWSQGDGASFTAKHIDIDRYLTGVDPLEFPKKDREQLGESMQPDEFKDFHGPLEPRRNIRNIVTKGDYREFKRRVAEFFNREGILNLSSFPQDSESFSWSPCECCRRQLGGNRILAAGYSPNTDVMREYEICSDCVYYAEYGRLDGTTLMELQDDEPSVQQESENVPLCRYENIDDDELIKDIGFGGQKWFFRYWTWPKHTSVSYWVQDIEPDSKPTAQPEGAPWGSEQYGLAKKKGFHPVGGHFFPKTSIHDLVLIGQAQIRVFKRTGYFDRTKYKNVWEWLKDARKQ